MLVVVALGLLLALSQHEAPSSPHTSTPLNNLCRAHRADSGPNQPAADALHHGIFAAHRLQFAFLWLELGIMPVYKRLHGADDVTGTYQDQSPRRPFRTNLSSSQLILTGGPLLHGRRLGDFR